MTGPQNDHWLVRPGTIRRLWIGFLAILTLLIGVDLAVDRHADFGVDGTFGFGAWFGFLSCVALIGGAKALGAVLKRPDSYYDR